MTKFNSSQTSFSKGYLSKRLAARPDIEEYFQACSEIKNFTPLPQGGIKKRNGTRLRSKVLPYTVDSSGGHPPVMFSLLSNDKEYMYVMYHDTNNPTDNPISIINPDLSSTTTNITANAKAVLNAMLVDQNESQNRMVRTTSIGKYILIYHTSGEYAPVLYKFEIAGGLIVQYADTWFEATYTDMPATWARTPYKLLDTSINVSTAGSNITITSTKPIFTAASVGQYYRFDYATTSFIVQVATYTSPTQVVAISLRGGGVTASGINNISRAYFGPESGYPKCTTTFQQRTVFANTFEATDTVFGSHVSNRFMFINTNLLEDKADRITELAYAYNFYGGIKNTDPYVFNIASESDTPIQWVAGGNVLYVGKSDGEYIMTGYEDLLGPLNVATNKKASEGGSLVPAIALEEGAFYVSANGKETNFLVYNERNGSSSSIGVSSTSYGLVEDLDFKYGNSRIDSKVTSLLYLPSANLVFAKTSGNLAGNNLLSLTYNSSVNSFAWAEFELGKDEDTGSTAKVLAMARHISSGALWFIISRTDNGVTDHSIEYWEPSGDLSTPQLTPGDESWTVNKYIPFDSCILLEYTGTPHTVINNPSATFANKKMWMYSNEGVAEIQFDINGDCTLPYPVMWAWYGYKFISTLTTVALQYGRESETIIGLPKKVDSVTFSLLNSKGGKWTDKTTYPIRYESSSYFTGDINMRVDTNFGIAPYLKITQDVPEPFTLLALTFRGVGYAT